MYELLVDVGSNYFRLEIDNNIVRLEVSTDGHNNLDYDTENQYRLRVCVYRPFPVQCIIVYHRYTPQIGVVQL